MKELLWPMAGQKTSRLEETERECEQAESVSCHVAAEGEEGRPHGDTQVDDSYALWVFGKRRKMISICQSQHHSLFSMIQMVTQL